jgi:hypothetical protein
MSDLIFLNHPRGTRDLISDGRPVVVSSPRAEPLALPSVDIHVGLFEVPYAEVVSLLPPSLHPSIPAYATMTFYRVDDSDIGKFEFAILGIGCRSGIRPRMLTLSSFASTDGAVDLLANWGFAAVKADVRTRLGYDAARSTIFAEGGRCLLEMLTMSPEPLLGGAKAIRYPQALNHAEWNGKAGLLQFGVALEYDRSSRGELNLATFDSQALTAGRLTPTDPIAGTHAHLSATLTPPSLLFDLNEPGQSASFTAAG